MATSNQTEQGVALAPCPFCGAAAHFAMDDARWEWIECESCGMQGNRSASLGEDCKPKLAEAWNRRATIPSTEGYTSDGWISVDDRLPAFAEEAEDDGVKVYTWDGELVTEDEFMPEYEQPAGPAVGGWMRTGEWFASDNLHRVTHWMPRRLPAGPVAAATAKDAKP